MEELKINRNNAAFCDFRGFWLAVLECLGMAILAELLAALLIRYNKGSISKL